MDGVLGLISFTPKIGANSTFDATEGIIVNTSVVPYYNVFAHGEDFVTANPTPPGQLP
jgi:hypothetical protein